MVSETSIIYEGNGFWVQDAGKHYEVLKYTSTHSEVISYFGKGWPNARHMAIQNAKDRDEKLAKGKS